jgi:uncharacterized protein (TIGR03437 family)
MRVNVIRWLQTTMLLVLWTWAAPAQVILTAGYGVPPSRIALAPGQIITFYLTDFANGVSLPIYGTNQASAQGIEAFMVSAFTGIAYLPVDIFLVESAQNSCMACGSITAVTLQIPMNMQPNFPGFPDGRNEAVLLIGDHISAPGAAEGCRSFGATCTSINVQLVPDQVHILQSCDSVVVTNRTSTCQPLIFHGDNSLVTTTSPGKQGETLVAYAVGMGSAGTGSTNGPVPLQDVIVGFGFAEPGRFGPAVLTAPNIAAAAVKPVYAGMVAGYPGLYQVNFKIPKLPSDISRSCNLSVDFPTGGSDNVNLIVSIARQQQGLVSSYDYAGICVSFPH